MPETTDSGALAARPRGPIDAHAATIDVVASRVDVDPRRGLTTAAAVARLAAAGPNELAPAKRTSLLALVIGAATEPFVVLLAVAGSLALALGEVRDGLLVLVGLLPIVGADVLTTYRGERALAELHAAAAPRAEVRRDGRQQTILARDLVAGDVVVLRVGDVVPADLRVSSAAGLTVDRAILTGESLPQELGVEADPPDAPLIDRRAVAHAGTAVVRGHGEGVVIAVGGATELGRIASGLTGVDRGRSPLQRELDRLVRMLLGVAIGLIAITSGAALLRGESLGTAVLAGVSAAIAAIPEEPPVLLAVVLGLGAYRLLRRGVLVRRLSAQETLGSVDLILTDKTGTLTENALALVTIATPAGAVRGEAEWRELVVDALRAEEDPWRGELGTRAGSFTRSLVRALDGSSVELDPADLLASESPTPETPYATTRARRGDVVEDLALGAPEAVLALSAATVARPWQELVSESAAAGNRLLLLAGRISDGDWLPRGLLVFADPIRGGIREAIGEAEGAGIQTIVVTGDHPDTAAAIARAAGIRDGKLITGAALNGLSEADLAASLPRLAIVARATPEQKLRLVLAARSLGRTVAVTGDGVNDAPALQRSDVGVAMGSGTPVAREAADLVLGDDSFATLMDGLREGRRIIANVQKGLVFLTSTHVALLGFILIGTLAGVAQPLLPIQILWMELFIDVAASVAFEREPPEPDIMRQRPRPRTVPLLTRGLLARIIGAGSVTAGAAFMLMVGHGGGPDHARWLAFTALVFGQLVRAYANRSLSRPTTSLGPNRVLAAACLVVGVVQLLIPHVSPLAEIFRATPLDPVDLLLVAVVAVGPALLAELVRWRRRTTWVA